MSAREIYVITNAVTGQWYIGCSHNAAKRMNAHLQLARKGSDFAIHINIRKYGEVNFAMEVLERCDVEITGEREKYWITTFKVLTPEKSLNVHVGGGGAISNEHRAKLSAAQIGNQYSLCHKQSEEHKARRSAAMIGNQNRLGKTHSDETKAKMSAAKKGKKQSTKICERCGLVCSAGNYTLWHGPNCKAYLKNIEETV